LRAKLGIDVRPSTLAGAGIGLFAYKTFPKGSKVASYSGRLVPASEAKDSEYAVAWRRGQVVDATSTLHSVGRTLILVAVLIRHVRSVKGIM
jgi:hypothetical protein